MYDELNDIVYGKILEYESIKEKSNLNIYQKKCEYHMYMIKNHLFLILESYIITLNYIDWHVFLYDVLYSTLKTIFKNTEILFELEYSSDIYSEIEFQIIFLIPFKSQNKIYSHTKYSFYIVIQDHHVVVQYSPLLTDGSIFEINNWKDFEYYLKQFSLYIPVIYRKKAELFCSQLNYKINQLLLDLDHI